MKKGLLITLIVIPSVLLLCYIVAIGSYVFAAANAFLPLVFGQEIYTETDDLTLYTEGGFDELVGGEYAKAFFPSYESLSEYESLEYRFMKYNTLSAHTMFIKFRSCHLLTVTYSEDDVSAYEAQKAKTLSGGGYDRYEKHKKDLHDPDEYCYFFLNNYSDYPLYAASLYEDDGDLTLTYIIYYDTSYKSAHDTYDGIHLGGANVEFPFSQDYLYAD